MGLNFRNFFNHLTCTCTDTNDGGSTVTIHVKGSTCCNKKKIVLQLGSVDPENIETLVREIAGVGSKNDLNIKKA